MASGAAGFEVGFVIGLNGVALIAFLTDPLLVITVLSSKVLLDSDEIAEGVAGVVVQAARLRADENPLSHRRRLPL